MVNYTEGTTFIYGVQGIPGNRLFSDDIIRTLSLRQQLATMATTAFTDAERQWGQKHHLEIC